MLNKIQYSGLKSSSLFSGLSFDELENFLKSASIYPKQIKVGEIIIEQGEFPVGIYVIVSGSAQGEKLTADGRAITVNTFFEGDVFGDVLSGALEKSPVSVRMMQEGEIISIPLSALLHGAEGQLEVHERILRNLISEIGKKYFALQRRVNLLASPTVRGKIAIYLLENALKGENVLISPHSREEQAQLFGCDRSALSRELSRMKKEGIIDVQGHRFEIKNRSELEKLGQ